MKTILLIEDDPVLRENTAELIELSGYHTITAANGKIGVEQALKAHPDLIVCDIMMPEMDGYAVIETLSKTPSTKGIPFIFLSAKTERQDIRKGMNLGADDYITKPFTEDELLSAIESRLAKMAIISESNSRFISSNGKEESKLRDLNDLKNFFDDNGEEFKFKKGDIIFEEGQNSNYIYLIRSGNVKAHSLDEHGKELITSIYREDDLFGYTTFNSNMPYQNFATALDDTELVGITRHELIKILNENHDVALDMLDLLSTDLTGARAQLLEMAYSSVNKKTAATILKFADKLNKKSTEAIKISRNDLASVAGIATETLIRTLSGFKKDGIIEIEGRNIKILDLERLQSIE